MELTPPAVSRVANSSLGMLGVLGSTTYGLEAGGVSGRVGAGLAVLGFAWLAVRGYQLGVSCASGQVTVRGFFRTRVILREAITEVTAFPALRWTSAGGRRHWTPMSALMIADGEWAGISRSKRADIARLRRWVRGTRH
ncbi:hypothetical protein OG304_04770 [Streptomyces sp. NBC_00160]|uniref:hypothetical protein n=1 Tax=Streptomyces sp. NBC_00160 TaxID=2903628 RepID=UPI0022504658|nr:hypothetical protein [Streptomyces sp. NBC_00160]MCX5302765.1 hypothetical protein [Streptomyces sp. NBC_00160]